MLFFNVDNGFLDGIVRGFKSGIITQGQYANLAQCESIEDLKLQLSATDYGNFLANDASPIPTTVIAERCLERLVQDFEYLRASAMEPLATFLDYITYGYMIDNVILLITGTLHQRDTHELLERCHPLGMFDSIAALCVATNVAELHSTVLVETPLAPYFEQCLSAHDLNEMNIEIIRNTLYKAYLEDFFGYCQSLGGATAEAMSEILKFEADRRVINITINSFNTELTKDDRAKLYPTCGRLHPDGTARLARVDDLDQVRGVVELYSEYRPMLEGGLAGAAGASGASGASGAHAGAAEKSMEDRFFAYEVHLNRLCFMQHFHYASFYAWLKLKEQEIRNIVWIAECISQQQRDKINNYIPIF